MKTYCKSCDNPINRNIITNNKTNIKTNNDPITNDSITNYSITNNPIMNSPIMNNPVMNNPLTNNSYKHEIEELKNRLEHITVINIENNDYKREIEELKSQLERITTHNIDNKYYDFKYLNAYEIMLKEFISIEKVHDYFIKELLKIINNKEMLNWIKIW